MSSASNAHGLGFASCPRGLALALLGAPIIALGQAAPDAPALDAKSCAALTAAAARGGGHFPLGRAACGLGAPPQRGLAPPSTHAQQLQLYAPAAADAGPAMPATAPAPAAAPTAAPAPAPVPRANGKKPTGVRAPVPRPTALPAAIVRAVRLAPEIDSAAQDHQIDPLLLHAIARIESRHNPAAVSHAGARGLMQVMPATGARFGVNRASELHDTQTNLQVGARYLQLLKQRYPGDLRLVLAAYNAGEGAVERHGRRVPPYAETQAYVHKVLEEYALLRSAAQATRRAPAHGGRP